MNKMKRIVSYIVGFLFFASAGVAMGAPVLEYRRTILPETTNTYDLGSSLKQWLTGYFGTICLSGDCKSAWPTGGGGSGGGAWATNTSQTLTYLTSQWTALINGTATTSTSSLEVQGNKGITSYGVINAPYFNATSTATSTFPALYSSTSTISNLNGVIYVTTKTGTAIQTALNQCASLGSGTVSLSVGVYVVNSTISFPMDAKCKLVGPKFVKGNGGGAELRANSSMTNLVEIKGNASATTNSDLNHDNAIDSVYLNGNNLVTNTLYLLNEDTVKIDNVRMTGGVNGIYADYNGVVPATASSIPGGLMVNDSIIEIRDNQNGYGIYLNTQTQSWFIGNWFEGKASSTMFVASSSKIKIIGNEFNSSDVSITFADSADNGTNNITVVGNTFATGITSSYCADTRTNASLSNYVSFIGNSVVSGLPCTIFNQGEVVTQSFKSLNNGNITFMPNGTGQIGIGTTTPQSLLDLSASNPTLALTDYPGFYHGGADPAGRFVWQNTADSLRLFRGTLGISASEIHRFTLATDTSYAIGISDRTAGVFNNTSLTYFSTTTSYINNGGNFGVGTTSPYAKLSVVGEIVGAYFTGTTTATSTFGGNLAINGTGTTTSSGGFNISAGCFAVNNICITGGGSTYTGTYPIIVSGTVISSSISTTSSNTWANTQRFAGANIIPLTTTPGNVDIRTTDAEAIDIGGSISLGGNNDSAGTAFRVFGTVEGRKENGTSGNSDGYLMFRTNTGGSVAERMRISSVGRVGIGTTSPYSMLSVAGQVVAQNYVATSTSINTFPQLAFTNGTGTSLMLTASSTANDFHVGTLNANTLAVSGIANFNGLTNSGGATTTNLAVNGSSTIQSSTIQNATTTTLFSSILNATTALFTSFTGTNATITNATTTNLFVGTSEGTGDALTIFGATSNEWSIGYKSSNKSFSISSSTALGTNEILTILKNGFLGLFNSSPLHQLDVKGRISGQPSFDCMTLFMSQSNVTADQLGSATVGSFACEGNMFVDVNTANAGILALTTANSEGMASGTPALQIMDASIATPAANNLVFLKTQVVGSATSSLGDGIAIEATIMTPKVSNATTSVAYVPLGFSDVAITSITTTASYTLPTNGCLLTASSTPNWKLVCRKAGVTTMADTGFATSTTAFKALLVLNQTGANVYINDSLTSSATISSANLPVTWLRPTVGVGLTAASTVAQGRLGIGNLKVWGQDKY